jgi:hypothetical protein
MLLEVELSTNISKILKKDMSEQFSKLQTKNPVIYFSLEDLFDASQIQKKHFCIISQKIFQNQLTNELYLPYGLSDS